MENRIYLRELPAYQTSGVPEQYLRSDFYYDMSKLPTQGLQNELKDFILQRSEQVAICTFFSERTRYNQLCRFLTEYAQGIQSFQERSPEEWLKLLRMWMMKEGIPLFCKSRATNKNARRSRKGIIFYLNSVLLFFKPEDSRPEQEKDVWELDKLNIEIRKNLIKRCHKLDFTRYCADRDSG